MCRDKDDLSPLGGPSAGWCQNKLCERMEQFCPCSSKLYLDKRMHDLEQLCRPLACGRTRLEIAVDRKRHIMQSY